MYMRLTMLFITAVLPVCAVLNGQPVKTDLQKMQLNGPVKFIRDSFFSPAAGKAITENCFMLVEQAFNTAGYLTEEKSMDGQGTELFTNTFSYNEKGQLKEKIIRRHIRNTVTVETFRPAGASMILCETDGANGKPESRTLFEYDARGNLVKESYTSMADTGKNWQTTYTYNEKNLLIDEASTNPAAEFARILYTYNADNRISEKKGFTNNLQPPVTIQFIYTLDGKKNWVSLFENPAGVNEDYMYLTKRTIEYY